MSLQAAAPVLDDRTYARLVAEAKALIPRYAPEWTDHNESDPGITLMQLFAWLTEMTLYRLNQVPELNYIKFLQLLGIELKPAQRARAELTFTLARTDVDTVIVPKGSRVAAQSDAGGPPLIFETDEALIALGAKLTAIQSFDGFSYSIETTKASAVGQWFYPFGAHAREGSALVLGFDSPLVFTKQQINLAVYLFDEGRTAPDQHCDVDLDQMPVPATLVWEYWDSRNWQPLSLDKDGTRALTRSGHILLRGPGDKAINDKLGEVVDKLYWIRCRLAISTYEQSPRLDMILTNTIGATQAITVRDEVMGGSDGRPNQVFRLANAPIVVRDRPEEVIGAEDRMMSVTSVRLEIAETKADDFVVWQEVDDFFASGPDDPHFVLNRTTGEARFGDGQHGRIPVANPSNANGNIVAREYRYGGGKAGNVGADAIKDLQSFIAGVDKATNLRPAFGGSEQETVSEAKLRAPRELKSKDRAVTAEDFETLTLATPGVRVRRAKALPLVHPKFPEAQVPGVVTVIVVPDSDAPNPMPSDATIATVCAHLNQHRLLTTEVYVVPPKYHRVKIEAEIVARPEADLAEVKNLLDERLITYFHPLKGGEFGSGWEFGRDIFYSDVYRVVLQTPGVDRIENNQLVIWIDNDRNDFCRDVPIEDGALLYSIEHDLSVVYSVRD